MAQRLLVVWLAYELASRTGNGYKLRAAAWRPQGGKGRQRGVCTGGERLLACRELVFSAAGAQGQNDGRGLEVAARLRPVFIEHDRSAHAERLALLSLARVASALARKADVALGDAGPEGSALARRVTGAALVRASHTPCVSCLAVLAQFRALLCEVALGVGLMAWRETCGGLLGDEAS
jgi:hypothetical protein